MNVKFCYQYRDGANYKNYNEVVFSNPNNKSLETIENTIKKLLIDHQWFIATNWELPDLHFKEYGWDPYIDHEWHEFITIEETIQPSTEKISIDIFLNKILSQTE